MAVTSIVTFVSSEAAASGTPALDAALALASACTARVVAFTCQENVLSPRSAEPDLSAARAAIVAQAERAGVPVDVVDRSTHARGAGEVFADLLKVADIGVIEVRPRLGPGERLVRDAAVFDSGRPVVLVGKAGMATAPKRIMLAWDDSPAAARAMTAALPLMRLAGKVVVVRVAGDKARRAEPGPEPTGYLARHGISATSREVPRGRGEVFADLGAAAAGFDLLVCGAVRRSRAQEILFGGVTGSFLDGAADMPVMLMA